MKKLLILSLSLLLVLCSFSACAEKTPAKQVSEDGNFVFEQTQETTNFVMISTKLGNIVVELYPDIAPITVKNFQGLVKNGFYDGVTFHRIVKGFVIQGGDPTGTGSGGSGKPIKGEFSYNGVENELSHTRGVISMARKGNDFDSATSQFFIVLSDRYVSSLDGQYAGFGKVVEGMDVVDALVEAGVGSVMNKVFFVDKVPASETTVSDDAAPVSDTAASADTAS
ncbi:MAG: peptidylprolyl isomerase [Lachnospiraceae bacterium]|nr:peptidylprolyl isomerase [Lachnospiraceae bacterium]